MVEYIKNKSKNKGYNNVFPVRVKWRGVDTFYKQHSFDRIFICGTYEFLSHPEDYFRELRPFLKKNNGRIYITCMKDIYDFSETEISDFSNLINILSGGDRVFPLFHKLEADIQHFVKNWRGGNIPQEIRKKIVYNLSKMLWDRWLFMDLMDYLANKGVFADDGERSANKNQDTRLIKWLFVDLDLHGAFDVKEKPPLGIGKRVLCKFNKILLCDILEIHGVKNLQAEFAYKKHNIIVTMERAGYRLVREYDFLPLDDFLEFKRRF